MPNVPAAAQAMAVLKLLGRHVTPVPAAVIARELGLPRSSAYHLLRAMTDAGFVVHLPEQRRYGLGVAAYELGSAYTRQEPLRWIAGPALARLVSATGHNGHFALLDGRDVVYVIEERAAGRPSLVTDVGVRLPAHLTASGRCLLAHLPETQLRALYPGRAALVQRTGRGPASLAELRRLLAETRTSGFGVEDGSVTPGFASVACAVLDHRGLPTAAVALTFPADEVGDGGREALAARARRAAGHVARGLGGRTP